MAVQYMIGIDEAGRGAIAGPVAVGAVCVPADFDPQFFEGIRDSKQFPQHKREEWFQALHAAKKRHALTYAVGFATAQYIDTHGIVAGVTRAIERVLRQLKADPEHTFVYLDGSLKAPGAFIHQETIIGGDASVPLISLASIAAKVRRDRKMTDMSRRFPAYGFEQHKGYGTKEHYRCIQSAGMCSLHRKSYIHI